MEDQPGLTESGMRRARMIDTHQRPIVEADCEIARLRDGRHRVLRVAELAVEGNRIVLKDVFAFGRERAAKTPEGDWIVIRFAFPTRLDEGRFPTKAELDEIAPKHPVLYHAGPAGMVNSMALKVSGITKDTKSTSVVKDLKTLGVEVDVQALYGVVAKWVLIATFDNTGMQGFDVAYPPEKGVDLGAKLSGKGEHPVRFVLHTTADPRGKIDLNAALGKEMGATAYAFAVIDAPAERPVEARVGSPHEFSRKVLRGEIARDRFRHRRE